MCVMGIRRPSVQQRAVWFACDALMSDCQHRTHDWQLRVGKNVILGLVEARKLLSSVTLSKKEMHISTRIKTNS